MVSELIETAKETARKLTLAQKQVHDYQAEIEKLKLKVDVLEAENRKLKQGSAIEFAGQSSDEPKIVIEKHRHTQIKIKE